MGRSLAPGLLFILCAACGSGTTPETPGESGAPAEAPASTQSEASPAVTDVQWEWVGTTTPVETIEVSQPERYQLLLQPDGVARMKFDCNNGSGSYQLTENQISFGPIMSTRMACSSDSEDVVFMSQLEQISSFFVQDEDLFLEMPADAGTMRFRRSPAGN